MTVLARLAVITDWHNKKEGPPVGMAASSDEPVGHVRHTQPMNYDQLAPDSTLAILVGTANGARNRWEDGPGLLLTLAGLMVSGKLMPGWLSAWLFPASWLGLAVLWPGRALSGFRAGGLPAVPGLRATTSCSFQVRSSRGCGEKRQTG
jgi:hypothetical protein